MKNVINGDFRRFYITGLPVCLIYIDVSGNCMQLQQELYEQIYEYLKIVRHE